MKIGIISTMAGFSWGGSEALWAAVAEEALAAGHEVAVAVYRWSPRAPRVEAMARRGAKVFERRRGQFGRLELLRNRFARPFRAMEAFRPDALLISQAGTYDLATSAEARPLAGLLETLNVPRVIVCHGNLEDSLPSDAQRRLMARHFACAYRVCFVAQRMREIAERQIPAAIPNAVIVSNPVNLADTSPLPWPGGEPAMAFVGHLEPVKGLDILLEVMHQPAWRDRRWTLDLYGEGPYAQYYQDLARHWNLADRVVYRGPTSDVRGVWANHHLCVMPSRSEGVPLTMVEAMLCGRVCVMTRVGGVAEWIHDGDTGFLASGANVTAYGEALERAWQQSAQWPAIGERARAAAVAQRDPHPGKTLLQLLTDAQRERN